MTLRLEELHWGRQIGLPFLTGTGSGNLAYMMDPDAFFEVCLPHEEGGIWLHDFNPPVVWASANVRVANHYKTQAGKRIEWLATPAHPVVYAEDDRGAVSSHRLALEKLYLQTDGVFDKRKEQRKKKNQKAHGVTPLEPTAPVEPSSVSEDGVTEDGSAKPEGEEPRPDALAGEYATDAEDAAVITSAGGEGGEVVDAAEEEVPKFTECSYAGFGRCVHPPATVVGPLFFPLANCWQTSNYVFDVLLQQIDTCYVCQAAGLHHVCMCQLQEYMDNESDVDNKIHDAKRACYSCIARALEELGVPLAGAVPGGNGKARRQQASPNKDKSGTAALDAAPPAPPRSIDDVVESPTKRQKTPQKAATKTPLKAAAASSPSASDAAKSPTPTKKQKLAPPASKSPMAKTPLAKTPTTPTSEVRSSATTTPRSSPRKQPSAAEGSGTRSSSKAASTASKTADKESPLKAAAQAAPPPPPQRKGKVCKHVLFCDQLSNCCRAVILQSVCFSRSLPFPQIGRWSSMVPLAPTTTGTQLRGRLSGIRPPATLHHRPPLRLQARCFRWSRRQPLQLPPQSHVRPGSLVIMS